MLDTLKKAFEDQVRDLYSAESQLLKALPRMAKAASSEALGKAFTAHLEETRGHVERLETIADMVGVRPAGKKCKAMEGLIEEGKEVLEDAGEASVVDLVLIAAAQRVEHYEIAAYGSACAMAERLGLRKAVPLLQLTLDEETAADQTLTGIAEGEVLPAAASAGENDSEPDASGGAKSRRNGGLALAGRSRR